MFDQLGIGIVGAGFAARMHALAARTLGATLVGIVASTSERSAVAATELGAKRLFRDAEELIEHPDVAVVHICTPNVLHMPLVELALKSRKHVICEKPLATSAVEAATMTQLAEEAGLRAAVAFAYRYQPTAARARDLVRSGELGSLHLVHGTYLQDWLLYESDVNWRTSSDLGGPSRAFADVGSHWCDLAEWITGERITEVAALTSRVHSTRSGGHIPVDTEDAVCVVFRATSEVVGSLIVSQVSPGRKNRLWLEVDGSRSSVVFDQENAELLWLGTREANRLIARDGTERPSEFPGSSALPPGHARGYIECFSALFEDVYTSIADDSEGGYPTFEDGLRSSLLTDAVLRAADSKAWEQVA